MVREEGSKQHKEGRGTRDVIGCDRRVEVGEAEDAGNDDSVPIFLLGKSSSGRDGRIDGRTEYQYKTWPQRASSSQREDSNEKSTAAGVRGLSGRG
jgi:hypothetical protein